MLDELDTLPPGMVLRNARVEAGLTLHALGKRAQRDTGLLSKVEKGIVGISPETLAAYEQVAGHSLGITPTAQSYGTRRKGKSKKSMENITPYGLIFSAFEKFNALPRNEQQFILEEAVARKKHLHQTTELVLADDGDWQIVHDGYEPIVPDEKVIIPFISNVGLDAFLDYLEVAFLSRMRKHLEKQRNSEDPTWQREEE